MKNNGVWMIRSVFKEAFRNGENFLGNINDFFNLSNEFILNDIRI